MEFGDNPEVQKILQQHSDPFFENSTQDFSSAALTKAESEDPRNLPAPGEGDDPQDNCLKVKRSNTGIKIDAPTTSSIDLTDLGPNVMPKLPKLNDKSLSIPKVQGSKNDITPKNKPKKHHRGIHQQESMAMHTAEYDFSQEDSDY